MENSTTDKKNLSRYTGSFQIREVEGDGNERKRILSFSSDTPYKRWFGLEILAHDSGCVDLSRLNEIGVLLFNHDRDAVVGKILRAWIEDGRGMAEVEFDTDEKSDIVFQKVTSGTLKGVSVGYTVDNFIKHSGKKRTNWRFDVSCYSSSSNTVIFFLLQDFNHLRQKRRGILHISVHNRYIIASCIAKASIHSCFFSKISRK